MANLPTSVSFSKGDIVKASQRRVLREGWYPFTGKSVKKDSTKNGHLTIKLNCAPLTDPEDIESATTPTCAYSMYLPFVNEEEEGHKAPNTAGICGSALQAIYGEEEYPSPPRRVDGSLVFKGEEIDRTEEQDAKEEVNDLVFTKLAELWEDPEELTADYIFFGKVEHDATGEWANIRTLRETLPDDAELVEPGSFIDDSAVKAKPNGKTKKKATTKKKVAAKKKTAGRKRN